MPNGSSGLSSVFKLVSTNPENGMNIFGAVGISKDISSKDFYYNDQLKGH